MSKFALLLTLSSCSSLIGLKMSPSFCPLLLSFNLTVTVHHYYFNQSSCCYDKCLIFQVQVLYDSFYNPSAVDILNGTTTQRTQFMECLRSRQKCCCPRIMVAVILSNIRNVNLEIKVKLVYTPYQLNDKTTQTEAARNENILIKDSD